MNNIATLSAPSIADQPQYTAQGNLQAFLTVWDLEYKEKIRKIDLFNPSVTSQYNDNQKEYFTRTFYHIRGHFYKFLWMLGNYAPNKELKNQILHNIEEEFGADSPSHEQLYFEFTKSLNLDITDEFLTEENHLPFIKEFNLKHLQWLKNNDWPGKWAAFSAYERLDNIDYANLLSVACSFGVSGEGLTFFTIHNKADHFDRTYQNLIAIWGSNQSKVREAFSFIASHQINMWKSLSDIVSNR